MKQIEFELYPLDMKTQKQIEFELHPLDMNTHIDFMLAISWKRYFHHFYRKLRNRMPSLAQWRYFHRITFTMAEENFEIWWSQKSNISQIVKFP